MPVTATPHPPTRADTVEALREQALIKEARQRARRRRQRYAAAVAIAIAIVAVGASFAMRPGNGGVQPSGAAHPLAPAEPSATRSTIVFAFWHPNITATLYTINADGTGLHRLLNASVAKLAGHWASWPALSPDGRRVAFQAGPWARAVIDVVKLDGSNLRQVAPLGLHPAWSPDGTKIAYSILRKPQGIYVVRADGTARRRLTHTRGIFPTWSPDGTKLAYGCPAARQEDASLCVMNADGTGQHRIAPVGDYAAPAWSPDGTKIAFLGGFPDVRVYLINANGTNLRRLAPPVSYKNQDCGPVWSPNGKQIAFSPAFPPIDGRTGGIYLMNPDGRNLVHLKGTTNACGITWQRTPA